jgi:hypothetical protein
VDVALDVLDEKLIRTSVLICLSGRRHENVPCRPRRYPPYHAFYRGNHQRPLHPSKRELVPLLHLCNFTNPPLHRSKSASPTTQPTTIPPTSPPPQLSPLNAGFHPPTPSTLPCTTQTTKKYFNPSPWVLGIASE